MMRIATLIPGDADHADRAVAGWLAGRARLLGDAEMDLLDLGAASLPDVPRGDLPTPAAVHDLTPWLADADGFLLVLREGLPAPLRHALSWCDESWRGKPVGLVWYGPEVPDERPVRARLDAVRAFTVSASVRFAGPDRDERADLVLAELARMTRKTPETL